MQQQVVTTLHHPLVPTNQQVATIIQNPPTTGVTVTESEDCNDTRVHKNFSHQSAGILGRIQIAIGLLCIIFQFVSIAIHAHKYDVGHGIWGGMLIIINGSIAVAASKRRTGSLITALLIISIFTIILSVFVMSFSANGVQTDKGRSCFVVFCVDSNGDFDRGKLATNGVIVVLALTEIVCAIWSSAISCGVICCGNRRMRRNLNVHNAHVTVLTNHSPQPHVQVNPMMQLPQMVHVQPQMMHVQPQMMNGQPQMVNGQPQMLNGQPPMMNGQPPMMNGQPPMMQYGHHTATAPPGLSPQPAVSPDFKQLATTPPPDYDSSEYVPPPAVYHPPK